MCVWEPVYDALVNKHNVLKTTTNDWCQYQMVSGIHKGRRLLNHPSLLAHYMRPSRQLFHLTCLTKALKFAPLNSWCWRDLSSDKSPQEVMHFTFVTVVVCFGINTRSGAATATVAQIHYQKRNVCIHHAGTHVQCRIKSQQQCLIIKDVAKILVGVDFRCRRASWRPLGGRKVSWEKSK